VFTVVSITNSIGTQ